MVYAVSDKFASTSKFILRTYLWAAVTIENTKTLKRSATTKII